MATRKSLSTVQQEFDSKFPNSKITVQSYTGMGRGGSLYHPEYGILKYARFQNLFRYTSVESLLHHLSINKLNTPQPTSADTVPPPTQPTPPTAADIIKLLGKLEVIEDLYHREHLSPSEFKSRVGKVLNG